MFNVFINNEGVIPTDDICYIVGKNGIFLKKKLGFLESISKVDSISILQDVVPYAKLNIPKIPKELVYQNINFLRWVYSEFNSEGMSILHFDDEREEYKSQVPQQWVSGGGISYVKNVNFKNYLKLGSIHSHANFNAFHSGTDKDDEYDWDGLHITFGNLGSEKITIASSIVANKLRFPVNPVDYLEGVSVSESTNNAYTQSTWYSLDEIDLYPGFPDSWKMFIEERAEKPKYLSEYSTNSSTKLSSLIKDYSNIKDNPCLICPHKELKIEMQMKEILERIGDEFDWEDEEDVWEGVWEDEVDESDSDKVDEYEGYSDRNMGELEKDKNGGIDNYDEY